MDVGFHLLALVWAVAQTVIALTLVAVGAGSVRPVEARAGYALVIAGALMFLQGCVGIIPALVTRTGTGNYAPDLFYAIDAIRDWLGLLLHAGAAGATVFAGVILARAVLGMPERGGAR